MEIILSKKDMQLEASLGRVLAMVSNLSPLMHRLGAFYERSVLENFQATG